MSVQEVTQKDGKGNAQGCIGHAQKCLYALTTLTQFELHGNHSMSAYRRTSEAFLRIRILEKFLLMSGFSDKIIGAMFAWWNLQP